MQEFYYTVMYWHNDFKCFCREKSECESHTVNCPPSFFSYRDSAVKLGWTHTLNKLLSPALIFSVCVHTLAWSVSSGLDVRQQLFSHRFSGHSRWELNSCCHMCIIEHKHTFEVYTQINLHRDQVKWGQSIILWSNMAKRSQNLSTVAYLVLCFYFYCISEEIHREIHKLLSNVFISHIIKVTKHL